MTRREAEARAFNAAKDGETRYVISYDDGEGREYAVETYKDIFTSEFGMFEGRVEAEVLPNGDITWF